QDLGVLVAERLARGLVERLDDTQHLALAVLERRDQDGAGAEARGAVDLRIEARVLVGVRDVHRLAGARDVAGDAAGEREAQHHAVEAPRALGPPLELLTGRTDQARA